MKLEFLKAKRKGWEEGKGKKGRLGGTAEDKCWQERFELQKEIVTSRLWGPWEQDCVSSSIVYTIPTSRHPVVNW